MNKGSNPQFSLGFFFPVGVWVFGILGLLLCFYFAATGQWLAIFPIGLLSFGLFFLKSSISIDIGNHSIDKTLILGGFPLKTEHQQYKALEMPCTHSCRCGMKGNKELRPKVHRGYILADGHPVLLFESKDKAFAEEQIKILRSELRSVKAQE